MGSSTALYEYLDTTGIIVPNTSTLLISEQAEYQSVFGADLIVTPDTPQGVLITAEVLARSEVVANNAALANQINPNIAGGVFFDAIWALTGGQRSAATQTQVPNVTLTGVAGTTILAGSLAATAAGDQFSLLASVTIPTGGSITGNFASVAQGAIPCAVGALTTVVSAVLGWETVTNATAGTLGSSTQSDQGARAQRDNTLGFQGVALPVALTSALYNVPGVTSLWFQENVTGNTETINGISMKQNSIYVCVAGGAELAIAAALLENKSSGCNWNGGTSVTVTEPASGQSYAVQYDIAAQIGILIQVMTSNGSATNIQTAILNYAAGLINGFAGFTVGASVSAFEIAGAILSVYPSYIITNLEISLESSVSYGTTPIAIGVNSIAYTQLSYITVNIT